jgi:gamma-glutamylcyclotransferase (GGCT)/AIG2-like uncharacterized protein YtfP
MTLPPATDEPRSLFVYGSLLDAAHRASLLGREVGGARARLEGYMRLRARYFYIVKQAGAVVEGLVLDDLDERDFALLDRYEDVPRLYTRATLAVAGGDGAELRCWIYLPTAKLLSACR